MFAVLGWYVLSGRSLVSVRWTRPRWAFMKDILRIGAIGSVNTLNTVLIMALLTTAVGTAAGPEGIAGFGTAARLEYLLIPIVFGLGAPLVAMVGTNIGAGQRQRALRVAFAGAAVTFALTETIGLAAAIWPHQWLTLFGSDPAMLDSGALYLRLVGPAYGFFGVGLSLYFSSQGAGRLEWPMLTGLMRAVLAVGGAWAALLATGSLAWVFAAIAVSLLAYGIVMTVSVARGVWFRSRFPAR
jgi:Na+-driven multidrug efflux pump